MKKFNADGGFRKDIGKEIDNDELINLKGMSLESSTEILDDTILFTDEDLDMIKGQLHNEEEEMHR